MVSLSSKQTTRELKERSLLLISPEGSTWPALSYIGKSRQGAGMQKTWGTCPNWGPQAESFRVPRLNPDWSIQTKKNRVLVSSVGVMVLQVF